MNIFRKEVDKEKYFVVTYKVKSTKSLYDAAWQIAIGQSVGNPNVRSVWETDELFENHSCLVVTNNEEKLKNEKSGKVKIAFPTVNINFKEDGVSHLFCQILGGQLDIDSIVKCRVEDISFPKKFIKDNFKGPKFGIEGIRDFTGVYNKPLLGGIIKPKIGINPQILLQMVKELVEGGVNFIKEDEIMSNPLFCTIEERVPLIMDYVKDKKVVYSVCINSDAPYLLDRVKKVYELGGNSIHVNFWSGFGSYKSIRDLDLPLFLHFQKSGDKILTEKSHKYGIDWNVVCKLAGLMGVDFIHAGMFGGYMSDNEKQLKKTLSILHKNNVMPALSCGMHPGIVNGITKRFGNDILSNVGGALHGHPGGTSAGAKAMRQAIDGDLNGEEYLQAIKLWGLKE